MLSMQSKQFSDSQFIEKFKFKQKKLTFVSPKPFLSTLAELRIDGVTLVCKRRTPLLLAMSAFGNSVAWNKKKW